MQCPITDYVKLLGELLREMMSRWPFELTAVAVLPDHLPPAIGKIMEAGE